MTETKITIHLDEEELMKLIDVCRKFGISYRMVIHDEDEGDER